MQNPWVLQQCVYRGYSQTDGCMIVRLRVHIHDYIYEYIYAAIYMSIHMYENIQICTYTLYIYCNVYEYTHEGLATNIGYIPSSHVQWGQRGPWITDSQECLSISPLLSFLLSPYVQYMYVSPSLYSIHCMYCTVFTQLGTINRQFRLS